MVDHNISLANLSGLPDLPNGIGLEIYRNESLINLDGLTCPDTLSYLEIQENMNLESLVGLENCDTISNTLKITGNQTLGNAAAINFAANISIGGVVQIGGNEL